MDTKQSENILLVHPILSNIERIVKKDALIQHLFTIEI